MPKASNLIDETFTRLTVLSRKGTNKQGRSTWNCVCSCGTAIVANVHSLRVGYTKSCGCLNTDTRKVNVKKMNKINKGRSRSWEDRFCSFVRRDKKSNCLEWIGDRVIGGYGRFWYKGDSLRTHRFIYTKLIGPIPDGMGVLHTCDNPCCVNITHLFLGTPLDNTRDMDRKGRRRPRGSGKRFGLKKPSGTVV